MKKFLVLGLLFLAACAGNDGTNGTNGAPGAQGPAGPAGINGTNGTNGVSPTVNNIACAVYDLSQSLPTQFSAVPLFSSLLYGPIAVVNIPDFNSPNGLQFLVGTAAAAYANSQYVGLDCISKLVISTAGTYQFNLSSDDGSYLYIDGIQVVSNDQLHGYPGPTPTGSAYLTMGFHNIEVTYFNNQGPSGLSLTWTPPNSAGPMVIDPSEFQ